MTSRRSLRRIRHALDRGNSGPLRLRRLEPPCCDRDDWRKLALSRGRTIEALRDHLGLEDAELQALLDGKPA